MKTILREATSAFERALLAAVVAGSLLTGCGGGGGGGGSGGDSGSGGGGEVPKAVLTFSPEDGATGVSVTIVPAVYVANAVINCNTVSAANFTLAPDGGSAVAGSIDCYDDQVMFYPDAPLAYSTTYVGSVTTMKASNGAALCDNCTWTFSTAAEPTFGIAHVSPADGAANVSIATAVTVTFDGPVTCGTVNATSFKLVDDAAHEVASTISCAGSSATLTPNALLSTTRQYTASVAATVSGANGVALPGLKSWTFTTAADQKVYIANPLQPISGKWVDAVGADGTGNGMLLYRQRVQSSGVYILTATNFKQSPVFGWYNHWDLWSHADPSSQAKIAVSKNGNALVLGKSDGLALLYAYYNAGAGTWSGGTTVGSGVTDFQPAIDDNGNGMLVWSDATMGGHEVHCRSYNATTGLGNEVTDASITHVQSPRFAFDPAGNGTVVYSNWQGMQYGGYTTQILSRDYDKATDTWSQSTTVVLNGHARTPDIAFDKDGNAVMVWAQEHLWVPTDASTAYWLVDGAFRAAGAGHAWVNADVGVGWDPKGDASDPRVVTLPNGDALATWTYIAHGETLPQVNASYHGAGSTGWGEAGASTVPVEGDAYLVYRLVSSDANGGVYSPSVVVDNNNNATLVYSKSDGARSNVFTKTFNPADRSTFVSGWSTSVEIESTDENADGPVIAVDGTGATMTIWNQWNPNYATPLNDFWYLRQ